MNSNHLNWTSISLYCTAIGHDTHTQPTGPIYQRYIPPLISIIMDRTRRGHIIILINRIETTNNQQHF